MYVNIVSNSIRFLSFNVRGMCDDIKCRKLFDIFKKNKYDVIMLQETHATAKDIYFWKNQWGGDVFYSNGTSASRGVMTLFRKGLEFSIDSQYTDTDGQLVILDSVIRNRKYYMINLYAPNTDQPAFFKGILDHCQDKAVAHCIVSGDFNLVLNPSLDRLHSAHNKPNATKALTELMLALDLVDVWRLRNPDKKAFMWERGCPVSMASRLDFFLVSHALVAGVTHVEFGVRSQLSDHRAVELRCVHGGVDRGPGYWKFNAMLLYNTEFVK